MINNILLETAKNGELTCSVEADGASTFLYSKYNPSGSIKIPNFTINKTIVVLGIGLGYELKKLLDETSNNIIVIDINKEFYNIIVENKTADNILNSDRIKFIFGEDIFKYDFQEIEIFDISKITKFNIVFFEKIREKLCNSNKKKKVALFDYPIILEDIIDGFIKLGYEIKIITPKEFKETAMETAYFKPDFLFSINFYPYIAVIGDMLKVKYISWTVDKPSYGLYTEERYINSNYIFHFENKIVEQLKNEGVKNIHYMPLAANIERLTSISLCEEEIDKYGADVSFLGTTISNNEINMIEESLEEKTMNKIEEIISIQEKNKDKYIIEETIDDKTINAIYNTNKIIEDENEKYISRKETASILISRKYDEIYRKKLVEDISDKFELIVFGDDWKKYHGNRLKFCERVDYYNIMPKVFKAAKINLNITRVCFDNAMPLRIFDILGAGGFLLTDWRKDIEDFFIDGEHLVVYKNIEELKDKIKFYLSNPEERKRIIGNALKLIREKHTYDNRLKEIMDIADKKNKLEEI